MLETLDDYNWEKAFELAGKEKREDSWAHHDNEPNLQAVMKGDSVPLDEFTREDVTHVFASDYGENDEKSWIMVGRVKDGRFFFLEAGCDYTGWD